VNLSTATPQSLPPAGRVRERRQRSATTTVSAYGEPLVWLTGGALAVAVLMIVGLLALILVQGLSTFWPAPLVQFELTSGERRLGEVSRREPALADSKAAPENAGRWLVRTGNFDLTGKHFERIEGDEIASQSRPEWGVVVERLAWGRLYGEPVRFLVDGAATADTSAAAWEQFEAQFPAAEARFRQGRALELEGIGRMNAQIEQARLAERSAELAHGPESSQWQAAHEALDQATAASEAEFDRVRAEIDALDHENDRYRLVLKTADGGDVELPLADVVRAYPANQLSLAAKLRIYGSRWLEFLTSEPREANSEGGVYPAIFGTVVMTLMMSLAVAPFGVLAALYLREYAKPGLLVSAVRISINNLAGVPSIVFGVFGLGFFCYIVGGSIDQHFFSANLPNPTFGKGGVLWASLTLALLTLPVVIVATEEALAAVPRSMREGSYACGASKWQTIRRIVLPRALPGIMTGLILAMARGAGEVAPLMLVGAVKLAPALPIDGVFPFLHPERSFMHLGFAIFDLGFQSQNSEAAKPMVYTTTLLLIVIIAVLNLTAIWLRARLRRKFAGGQF